MNKQDIAGMVLVAVMLLICFGMVHTAASCSRHSATERAKCITTLAKTKPSANLKACKIVGGGL